MKTIAVSELWDVLADAQVDAESECGAAGPPAERSATTARVPSWEAMRGRRSVRDISDAPVTLERISLVLDRATALERELFGADETLVPLTCLVLLGTDEVVEPLGHRATSERRVLVSSQARTLRETYCDVPALLFFGADTASALSHEGVQGYRRTTMRIGALTHATWLAAREDGLEGSVYGRASDQVSRLMMETRGTGWRHVFTLALGEA